MVFSLLAELWRELIEDLGGVFGIVLVFLAMMLFTLVVNMTVSKRHTAPRQTLFTTHHTLESILENTTHTAIKTIH